MSGIADLDAIVESLPTEEKELFRRIFRISVAEGGLKPPQTMHRWIKQHFGSVEATLNQKVVRVTNLITFEEALFNKLRASRPIAAKKRLDVIADESVEDPLRLPQQDTPEDLFGRVEGKHCITASNIAKYDGLHGMVIFNEPNPLHFTREQVFDYIDTGWRWAQKAHQFDPHANYFFFMWNCLWRAGASLVHGHAQVSLSRDVHYAKIEQLRRAALSYKARYGASYFDELYQAHRVVGCGFEVDGVRVLAYLTPIKEKEVVLMAGSLAQPLKKRIYQVLSCFRDKLGVGSFNLALRMPPIAEVKEDWDGFPVLVHLVDRGDLGSKASDIGAMELYASSVISSDPFEVARVLSGI